MWARGERWMGGRVGWRVGGWWWERVRVEAGVGVRLRKLARVDGGGGGVGWEAEEDQAGRGGVVGGVG